MSKPITSGIRFITDGVHPALAAFVIFVLAAVAWIPHLGQSLLLDETLTFWVIRDGLAETLDRTLHFQPQPAYYLFMWFFSQFAGTSEIALRIPSLIATLAACYAIAKLGALLAQDRETGLIAAIVFATTWNVYREAIDARSYMLGLVVLLALALCLIRWLEEGHMRNAGYCGVLAVLLPHLHLFFVLCYPALFAYGWFRRGEARWEAKQFGLISAILVVGALLYLPVAEMLAAQGGSYSFVASPRWRSLFEVFVWVAPVAGLLVGTALAGVFGHLPFAESGAGREDNDSIDKTDETQAPLFVSALPMSSTIFLATWMLVPLVLLFSVSFFTDLSVFLGRYLIPAIPAVSILYAIALRRIDSGPARIVAIGVMILASLVIHERPRDDFRAAAEAVNEFIADADSTPVFLASGLIEGEEPKWLADPVLADYLNAPTEYYPIKGRLITLPRRLKGHPMTAAIVRPILSSADRFVVVEWFGNGARATGWFLSRAEKAGYVGDPRSFGGVRVVFFKAKAS